jgi:hypothetical protein
VFVLEARPARASLIPTDLGAGLQGAHNRLGRQLDPMLADLELRFEMPESLGPSPETFFNRPEIVLTGGNLPLAGGKPFFGLVRQNGTPDLLRSWIAEMAAEGLSASRMAQAKRVVSAVLPQALSDGLIGRNPAATVKVPKTQERQPRFLSAEQVTELAETCELRMDGAGVLVKLLSYAAYGGEKPWH